METNLFHEYRDEFSFDTVQEVVNELPEPIERDAPEVAATALTPPVRSILEDIDWDTLDRKGPRTMWDSTYIAFECDRPEVKVRVTGDYETDGELQKSTIHIVFKQTADTEVVDFIVHRDGRVTTE